MLDFGIEIEFYTSARITQQSVAAAMTAAGIDTWSAGYTHLTAGRWKVVSDASILGSAGTAGHELVSPPLSAETGFETLRKVGEVLAALDAQVNKTCGLHVHFGARNQPVATLRKLAELYVQHEELIDQMVPPSRRGNGNLYCGSNKTRANLRALSRAQSLQEIANAVQGGSSHRNRRVKLNFAAFWRHGTVEFRHHAGTVNAERMIQWVKFCSRLIETAAKEAAGAVPSQAPVTNYWTRGRRTRTIFQLLSRPEGATAEEIRIALGVNSRPNVRWHLANAGLPEDRDFRSRARGGDVFRLLADGSNAANPFTTGSWGVSTTSPPATTLEEFFGKLDLAPEDKEFWTARVANIAAAQIEQTTPRNNLSPVLAVRDTPTLGDIILEHRLTAGVTSYRQSRLSPEE